MAAGQSTPMRSPVEEMNRVLDRAPPVCTEALRDETRLTGRWLHGAIHDRTEPMCDHVVMTYYGAPQRIDWRDGRRQQSLTRSDSITLIPSGHEARWDIGGPIEVSHVYLPHTRVLACAEASGAKSTVTLLDRVGFVDATASQLLQILAREGTQTGSSIRLMLEQAIDLLCLHLLRSHSSTAASVTPQVPRKGLPEWQVRKIHAYMREHIHSDVGLDELAALVGLSRFHFCTAFRKSTGFTPYRLFTSLRIARARELLLDPGNSITEVGCVVGYETPSAFARAFRAVEGISPSEFRCRASR